MKPTDKITVEITLAELAKIYAVMGLATGRGPENLYWTAHRVLSISEDSDTILEPMLPEGIVIEYHLIEDEWLNSIFNRETEQQKRIRELKETIAKAQQQIEELEEQME